MNCLRNLFFILGSKSPRRIELLKNLNLNFEVKPSGYIEESPDNIEPEKYVQNNSIQKAKFLAKTYSDFLIATFDTVVVYNNNILGKPLNKKVAFNMLSLLSNKTHRVLTAYTLLKAKEKINITKYFSTEVTFKKLSKDEILWYVNTEEPYDKAGSYAIQGIGSFMIKEIKGSYTNVVGLPLAEFLEDLKKLKLNYD